MSWILAATCKESTLLPDLYKGLRDNSTCNVDVQGAGDLLTVLANAIQIALRLAGIAAVVFIVIGGIMYIASLGDPARTARAKETILYAVVGLVISLAAYGIVAFISGRF